MCGLFRGISTMSSHIIILLWNTDGHQSTSQAHKSVCLKLTDIEMKIPVDKWFRHPYICFLSTSIFQFAIIVNVNLQMNFNLKASYVTFFSDLAIRWMLGCREQTLLISVIPIYGAPKSTSFFDISMIPRNLTKSKHTHTWDVPGWMRRVRPLI